MWKDTVENIRARLSRERLAKLGWYAALAALLMILGSASYAYRMNRAPRYDAAAQSVEPQAPLAVMAAGTPQPLEALFRPVEPTPEPTPEPLVFIWPVEGEVIGEYAPDALVWSQTLGQWQNHPGVDISAAAGEAVVACADGTVREAWEDPLWGCVVEIGHDQGFVSTYANLSTLSLVKPGDAVTAGQVVGAVGGSADCESEMPWHLHFELRQNGAPVDSQKLYGLFLDKLP